MKITRRLLKPWYTAVTDTNQPVVILSGPYATKEDADRMIADPGSRDRQLAEEMDPKAHFYRYLTVRLESPPSEIVTKTIRGRLTLTEISKNWLGPMNDWLGHWAMGEYEKQHAAHVKAGRKAKTFRFVVPEFQSDLIDAMNAGDEERAKALKLSRIP